MQIEHKAIPFEVKAVEDSTPDDPGGEFTGLGGAFWNLDSTGDVIAAGAFKDDIPNFLADGFIGGLNHDWDNPIGHPVSAEETPDGLLIRAALDDIPDARKLRTQMKANPATGRATIRKLSIGYSVLAAERAKDADAVKALWTKADYKPSEADLSALDSLYTERKSSDGRKVIPGVRVIRKLRLFEVSPVARPANDRATIIGAKYYGGSESYPMSVSDPAALLGDTNRVIAYTAMSRLHDMLCMATYAILGKDDLIPLDAKLVLIGEAIDQYKAALIPMLAHFLGGLADDDGPTEAEMATAVETMASQMAAQFKARFGLAHDPAEFSAKLAAATTASFADQSRSVVSAVEGLIDRARVHRDARYKEGRELSVSNRSALTEVRDGLRDHAESIDSILARSEKPAKSQETPEAIPQPAADVAAEGKGAEVVPADPSPVAEPAPIEAPTIEPTNPVGDPVTVESEAAPESDPAASESTDSRPDDESKAVRVDPAVVRGLFSSHLATHEAPRWGLAAVAEPTPTS